MNIIKKKITTFPYFQKLDCNITYPKNKKELKDILYYAKKNNLSAIAMGHGCSFSDLFMHSKGIIINFKNLNKIINFNSQNNTLLVEPGINVSQVNQFLFKKILQLIVFLQVLKLLLVALFQIMYMAKTLIVADFFVIT